MIAFGTAAGGSSEGGSGTPFPEAPNDGLQYGRQSKGWTPIEASEGGDGGGTVAGGMICLGEVNLEGLNNTSFVVDPDTCTGFVLVISGSLSTPNEVGVTINNDVAANYYYERRYASSQINSAVILNRVTAAYWGATAFQSGDEDASFVELQFMNPADTAHSKMIQFRGKQAVDNDGDRSYYMSGVGQKTSTAKITSIQVKCPVAGVTFRAGSKATLYALPKAGIAGVPEAESDVLIPLNAGWTTPYPGWGNEGDNIRVVKRGKEVHLYGIINGTAGVICTLPPEYRPRYAAIYPIVGEPLSAATLVDRIQVNTAGEVLLVNQTGGAGTYKSLAGIRYVTP